MVELEFVTRFTVDDSLIRTEPPLPFAPPLALILPFIKIRLPVMMLIAPPLPVPFPLLVIAPVVMLLLAATVLINKLILPPAVLAAAAVFVSA